MILADVHSDFLVWRLLATKPELREYKPSFPNVTMSAEDSLLWTFLSK
jgi:hypothetical protein